MRLLLFIIFLITTIFQGFAQDQYVMLISLDGYRHDYTERFHPPHIEAFISSGTAATSMIPSFPSKTFPNHYTIATGMKPGNHGLVDNTFFSSQKSKTYRISDRSVVQDGSWYGGTPIWVQAEKHGVKSASYFFVGSEAAIQGIRPSYYYDYNGTIPNTTRIDQVLEWLRLPDEERPRMITLYFSDMDDTGHKYGPNNDLKLKEALFKLDEELGILFDGVKKSGLPVNIIIVSDHGMTNITQDRLIDLEKLLAPFPLDYYNDGALAHLHLKDTKDMGEIRRELRKLEDHFSVVDPLSKNYYGKHINYSERVGDLLIIPDPGYYLVATSGFIKYQNRAAMFDTDTFGEHGFHPSLKDMHAIFYANGPRVKSGHEIKAFENIHVYPLICRLLGLPIPKDIDGQVKVLEPVLLEEKMASHPYEQK
ncbi:alkaline phosphatase family protein [Echinicola soli]|uniref:Alkaline phosphatase family protein n=1 Tax=Echinicola soli TaxID=2591634 RepID=A0A514CKW1_9BACT|nr:ectonucleotide pyrophosphatase/phosphodiesterase [Echinicola soli]QDH80397.1 alkaline phosphatase family protein [Echinicola soli]